MDPDCMLRSHWKQNRNLLCLSSKYMSFLRKIFSREIDWEQKCLNCCAKNILSSKVVEPSPNATEECFRKYQQPDFQMPKGNADVIL